MVLSVFKVFLQAYPLKVKSERGFLPDMAFSCSNLNKAQFGKPKSRLQQKFLLNNCQFINRNEMLQSCWRLFSADENSNKIKKSILVLKTIAISYPM